MWKVHQEPCCSIKNHADTLHNSNINALTKIKLRLQIASPKAFESYGSLLLWFLPKIPGTVNTVLNGSGRFLRFGGFSLPKSEERFLRFLTVAWAWSRLSIKSYNTKNPQFEKSLAD